MINKNLLVIIDIICIAQETLQSIRPIWEKNLKIEWKHMYN